MTKARNRWRFLDSGTGDGAFNMAVDEVLATHLQSSRPVLRVYAWQPWTISLGYHQEPQEIDLQKCQDAGLDVVRRPTGGRAILHAREVTYSVIFPATCAWYQQKTSDIYNYISAALVRSLKLLGLPAALERNQRALPEFRNYNNRFACFATSAKYEIQFDARKIVGSAQRKFKQGLLQHGSIILGNEHLNLVDYVTGEGNGHASQAREHLEKKTASVETILGRNVTYEEVADSIKVGFEKYFGISCQSAPLTGAEVRQINRDKPKFSYLRRTLS